VQIGGHFHHGSGERTELPRYLKARDATTCVGRQRFAGCDQFFWPALSVSRAIVTGTADRPTALGQIDGLPTSSINALPSQGFVSVTACRRQARRMEVGPPPYQFFGRYYQAARPIACHVRRLAAGFAARRFLLIGEEEEP
jgi:hypothetical protein